MRNTSPKPPIKERSNTEVIEDLCIALRNVAVFDSYLPTGDRVKKHILEVHTLHEELILRGVDISARISELSKETSWQMRELLDDCLAFPQKLPYVKETDGIRRTLRCRLCRKAERPPDAKLFWFCNSCMQRVVTALRQRTPYSGIVLFRSYTPECRCSHADADTTLAAEWYIEELNGVCEKCILEEIERRDTKRSI